MTHYLVGSRALEYWGVGFTANPSSDWDIICPKDEAHIWEDKENVDVTFLEDLLSEEILDNYPDRRYEDKTFVQGVLVQVASLGALAIMKRSHLWRDLNWEKHISQYHFTLLPETGWRASAVGQNTFVKTRAKLTKEKYPQPHPDLSKTNGDFFDDAVKKDFDHDWIHELVAYGKRPLFEKLKHRHKTDLAWCEKDLWDNFTHEEKLKCVAEEAHVIACERFLIPTDWTHSHWGAYMRSVKKVCTTLCSGWFRDFAIDNYPQVVDKFDMSKLRLVKEMTKGD